MNHSREYTNAEHFLTKKLNKGEKQLLKLEKDRRQHN